MANIIFLLAALLFSFGVLLGSTMHTHAVRREYRRIAQRVRELHELEEDLAHHNKVLVSSHDRRISSE